MVTNSKGFSDDDEKIWEEKRERCSSTTSRAVSPKGGLTGETGRKTLESTCMCRRPGQTVEDLWSLSEEQKDSRHETQQSISNKKSKATPGIRKKQMTRSKEILQGFVCSSIDRKCKYKHWRWLFKSKVRNGHPIEQDTPIMTRKRKQKESEKAEKSVAGPTVIKIHANFIFRKKFRSMRGIYIYMIARQDKQI